jgi:hypothetical protein
MGTDSELKKPADIKYRSKKKRTRTTVLGALVLVFAAVGLCVCLVKLIGFGVGTISEFAAPKENTSYYEKYLTYIVGLDPQPYSGVSSANPDWMLKAAAWAAVSDDTSGAYGVTADSRVNVPAADITKYFKKYFGDNVVPVFHTFTDNGIPFEYSSALKCFYVPKSAIIYVFTPKVTAISRTPGSDRVTLTVQYLPKSYRTTNDASSAAPAASKTMIYELRGSNGRYYIDSIQAAPAASSSKPKSSSSSSASSSASAASSASSSASSK